MRAICVTPSGVSIRLPQAIPAFAPRKLKPCVWLPERLRAAVSGLNDAQLDTPYRDGGWTVRQVVHHFADSHANTYVRFKLALTEDWPHHQALRRGRMGPATRQPHAHRAIARLPRGMHQRLVALLESMSEEDFQRSFNHPERGRMTLSANLALYDWHSRHHTAHITSLRSRMGW